MKSKGGHHVRCVDQCDYQVNLCQAKYCAPAALQPLTRDITIDDDQFVRLTHSSIKMVPYISNAAVI